MKIFLIVFILCSSLFSMSINHSLLKVHATLLPKIYLMEYDVDKKIKNDTIDISIFYTQNTYKSAKVLKNMILEKYKDGIKKYKISIHTISYSSSNKPDSNIYYLLPTSKEHISSMVKKAKKTGALTFSYLEDDLHHGVMISLNVSKKIKPVLNLDAIKENKISLRPVLIKISCIFHKKDPLCLSEQMFIKFIS